MFPGTSTMNQLDRIIEVTGRPTKEDIEAINSPFAATMLESLPEVQPKPLSSMFPNTDEDALDLLSKLLHFNPEKRITAEEALEHAYVEQFHNIDEEPKCPRVIQIPINDNKKLSVAAYREELYRTVIKVKDEVNKQSRGNKPPKEKSSKSSKAGGAPKQNRAGKKKGTGTGTKKSSSSKKPKMEKKKMNEV